MAIEALGLDLGVGADDDDGELGRCRGGDGLRDLRLDVLARGLVAQRRAHEAAVAAGVDDGEVDRGTARRAARRS